MPRSTLEIVRAWHTAFEVPIADQPGIPQDRAPMRLAILEEEVAELRAAVEAGDLTEVLDALCDIQYVLDGTFLEFGLHGVKQVAMEEVHASRLCCKLCHKSHLPLGQKHLCCELFLQPGHCFSHDTRPNAEGPLNHALLTNGVAGQIVRPSLTFS